MMKALALDVGEKRIGIAVNEGSVALPLFTLHRKSPHEDVKAVARFVRQHAAETVVVGLPLHADGTMSEQAGKVQEFAEALRTWVHRTHPEVRLEWLDERHTTQEAHALLDEAGRGRRMGAKERVERSREIDQVAAVLILEAWMGKA